MNPIPNDADRAAAEALFRDLANKNKLAAVFSLSVCYEEREFVYEAIAAAEAWYVEKLMQALEEA